MSWFSKISRVRGETPMGLDEIFEDNYSRQHRNPRDIKKKDRAGAGLITTLGPSAQHSSNEISIENVSSIDGSPGSNRDDNKVNSLSDFNQIDSKLYEGQVMEDTVDGVRPRTDNKGGPGSATDDSPGVLGVEDDGAGSYILRHTPGDRNTTQEAIRSNLDFQKRPSRRREYNGYAVNVN